MKFMMDTVQTFQILEKCLRTYITSTYVKRNLYKFVYFD